MRRLTSQEDWDNYFLGIAGAVSVKSKDPKSKLGAVLTQNNVVVSTGFNGFPRGIDERAERWERPIKYQFVSHAEANAIFNAARNGIPTVGGTLYLYGFPGPCIECAKAIIQAGVLRVVWPASDLHRRDPEAAAKWKADLAFARALLAEAGVIFTESLVASISPFCADDTCLRAPLIQKPLHGACRCGMDCTK